MSLNLQKERQIIDYIKKLTNSFKQQQKIKQQDSLVVSSSQISAHTIKLQITPPRKKKQTTYAKKYKSPYKQNQLSISKIQQTGRPKINPPINFSNTLLQIASHNRQKLQKQNSPSSQQSRYLKNISMFQKLEVSSLDVLRMQAKQMHQIKQRQREAMTPRQNNQKWADFLLRQRKWDQERRVKQFKKKALIMEQNAQHFKKIVPRQVRGLSRQNALRKVKRQKLKLEQQLNQMSIQTYRKTSINMKSQKQSIAKYSSRSNSTKVVLSDSNEVKFLVRLP